MFVVVEARAVPEHVKGYASRFLVEVTSSLYVGTMSRKVADELWDVLVEHAEEGGLAMVLSSSSTEQGYEVRLAGEQLAEMRDFDGVQLPVWNRKIASHAH